MDLFLRLFFILLLCVSAYFLFDIKVEIPKEDPYIKVEVRGEAEEETVILRKGDTLEDLLKEIDLSTTADLSSISLQTVLYDGQIVSIPKKEGSELISLNHADLDDLCLLPGIGRVTAEKIITYRQKYGSFHTLEELMNVKGIGEKKFEKIRKYLSL